VFFQVIFSDETYIDIAGARSHFVRRGHERIGPSHITARRAYVTRILFWGCMSAKGTGPLVDLSGTIDATAYQHILDSHLRPTALRWFGRHEWWYQQDNAPAHKAASTRRWLENHHIRVIEWPPYSPDLNPIENLWALLKQEVHKESAIDRATVVNRAVEFWNSEIFQTHCRQLVDSMHRRCFECVRSNGGPTGY
jgi:hypothetical protein